MILLFEDDERTPVSTLLKQSKMGHLIRFSNGNGRLQKVTDELLYTTNEDIVILCDVVFDNRHTISVYGELYAKYKDNNRVYLLPIVCIEFYVLKMLKHFGMLNKVEQYYNILQTTFNWSAIQLKGSFDGNTLEKFYKYLCSNSGYPCTINKNVESKEHIGKFYKQDCSCTNHCNGEEYSLAVKSSILLYYLPFVLDVNNLLQMFSSLGLLVRKSSFEKVLEKQLKLYDKMAEDLHCINYLRIQ